MLLLSCEKISFWMEFLDFCELLGVPLCRLEVSVWNLFVVYFVNALPGRAFQGIINDVIEVKLLGTG